jgi:hypothetical protein
MPDQRLAVVILFQRCKRLFPLVVNLFRTVLLFSSYTTGLPDSTLFTQTLPPISKTARQNIHNIFFDAEWKRMEKITLKTQ